MGRRIIYGEDYMTFTTVVKTDKAQKFEVWLERLRDPEIQQTKGALCKLYVDGTKKYCCIGILDEVVLGTSWHQETEIDADYGFAFMADDVGETGLIDDQRVADMDLDKVLTEEEQAYFLELVPDKGFNTTRIHALAMVNDAGEDFDTIADTIEELGWDSD